MPELPEARSNVSSPITALPGHDAAARSRPSLDIADFEAVLPIAGKAAAQTLRQLGDGRPRRRA